MATLQELKAYQWEYRGALLVERMLPGERLRRLVKLLFYATLFFAAAALVSSLADAPFAIRALPAFSRAAQFSPFLFALSECFSGLFILAALLFAFFASSYFKDIDSTFKEFGMSRRPAISHEVAEAVSRGSGDALVDMLLSRPGQFLLARLGLSGGDVAEYLKSVHDAVSPAAFTIEAAEEETLSFTALVRALLAAYPSFRQFLSSKAIEERDVLGAADWVSRTEALRKSAFRFWGRDALGRISGIGKDWGYGETALLERYALPLEKHPAFREPLGAFGKRETEEVERILSRGREANVLLVYEEGVPVLSILVRFGRAIRAGTVFPPLEHKRIFILDGAPFASAMKEKATFERELTHLLAEAARAGNIILVIAGFEKMLQAARALQSDAIALLEPFLSSPLIQLVATAEVGAFHAALEGNPKIREGFERVLVSGVGAEAALPALEEAALLLEAKEGVYFTFQALKAASESAERYFFEGVMPDKAIDLLHELPPQVKAERKRLIVREDVEELVSRKTGIATGAAKGEERTKLLRLEEILHERIVGQEAAVAAISGALRRARSGVGNPNRPAGSFLFLGPTGVGKTETTKALAQVFFGDEKQIVRFDMSEFETGDALQRLIGSSDRKPGALASALREHPFGVLLLDEFEKTNKDVHDLFLQILDEGFFTDAAGKRVNARNLMIIATSNAGSDLIWNQIRETGATGVALDKDKIVAEIINRGIFKPELLNRFDGVILFHPLEAGELRSIARLQLEKLAKRLEEKGLTLVISDALLDYLVSVGQDPKFGARPMNRAIAEHVEQKIAERLLRGEIAAGSLVEFSVADLRSSQSAASGASSAA